MKSSEILRNAAKLIEEGVWYGGCSAINSAARDSVGDGVRALEIFKTIFLDHPRTDLWWGMVPASGPRIIGLCLAAAIAESEGD